MALWIISSMMIPQYSAANTLVVRKVYSTLHDSCFTELKWAIHRLGVDHLWKIKESPLEMTYTATGQKIYFRGMDDPLKITSIAVETGVLCFLWLEEAYELDNEADFDTLTESMLGDCPPGLFKQVTLTFNPWSSSTWIKKRFFDAPPSPDVLAITTTYRCNEWLSDADKAMFEQMAVSNPQRFKVAGNGEWGIEGETFFEEWTDDEQHYRDRLYTHVIEPFEIPDDWRIYRGFDFGYAKPFSVTWWACDHDGRLYHILELYGCTETPNTGVKWAPDEIFREIKRVESEHRWLKGKRIYGIADPSIWDASRGVSIAEMGERMGVYFEPGDNKRIPGWMQMHYRLRFDENGIPMMYVFKNCRHFIRTIPLLQYDEVKPEDIDTDMEDHIADSCLVGDTEVWTDSGKRRIADLVGTAGRVLSSDGAYHAYHDVRMTQSGENVYTVEMDDGNTVTATANHPFRLKDGTWKRLDELKEGDELWTMREEQAVGALKVKRIVPAGKADVYNMEVEDTHDFAVNGGAIVHNCRYVCMARPISPAEPEKPKARPYSPLDTDEDVQTYGRYDFYTRY